MYRVESGVRMHIPINLVTGSSFLILSFLLSFPSLSYRGPTTSYTILPWRQFHNSSYHFQVRSSASVQSFLPHTRSSPPFSLTPEAIIAFRIHSLFTIIPLLIIQFNTFASVMTKYTLLLLHINSI